jgi:hypothetical protein
VELGKKKKESSLISPYYFEASFAKIASLFLSINYYRIFPHFILLRVSRDWKLAFQII